MKKRYTLLLLLILSTTVGAMPSKELVDELNPQRKLDLKWRNKLGLSTYRTNIVFQNERLIVGSNGSNSANQRDRLDGIYVLNPDTGDIEDRYLEDIVGDRDVNGIAASSERIFWGDDNSSFYAYNWKKELQWVLDVGGDVEGTPALEDFNADGVLDVCFATEAGELMVINGVDGSVIWQFQADYQPIWTYPASRSFMASPTLTDINRDGIRDVLIGNRNGRFYAFNGRSGEELWSFRTQTPAGIFSSAVIHEGRIFFAESYSVLYELNGKGEEVKRKVLISDDTPRTFSSPAISPKGSIAIGSSGPRGKQGVWVLSEEGKVFHPIGRVSASPIVADILGNRQMQFIVISESGWLYVLSETGEIESRYSLPYGAEATPYIDDIDFDGKLELILFTNDQFMACYDTNSRGDVYIGGFRSNPYNTGVINDTIDTDLPSNKKKKKDYRSGKGYTQNNIAEVENTTITPTSIGNARIGMTFGKLKAVLGKKVLFKDVDLGIGMKAKAVISEGRVRYYILYPSWKTLTPTDIITVLATNNPEYRTEKNIGPGSTIDEAAKAYGDPTLTYHLNNSKEELIHFNEKPPQLWFARYNRVKAGIYEKEKPFNLTREYNSGSRIEFIGVKK